MVTDRLYHGIDVKVYGGHIDAIAEGIIADGVKTIAQADALQVATAIEGVSANTAQLGAHDQMHDVTGLASAEYTLFGILDDTADAPGSAVRSGPRNQILVADITYLRRLDGLIIRHRGLLIIA